MNIRSISNPAAVLGKEKIEASKTIKSDETDEREANGQQPHGDSEPHRPLEEEEVEQVIAKIRENEGIKNAGLTVEMLEENGKRVAKILAPDGSVVKRFGERDLYFFLYQSGKEDIHLVNKTA